MDGEFDDWIAVETKQDTEAAEFEGLEYIVHIDLIIWSCFKKMDIRYTILTFFKSNVSIKHHFNVIF